MKRSTHFRRSVLSGIVAAVAVVGAPIVHAAHASDDDPWKAIKVEAGNKEFLVAHAAGTQTYKCISTTTGYAWGPSIPSATLVDDKGKLVATHFGGPTWQGTDGSIVVGQRVKGVTVDPTAIPWLLLGAASVSAGADGDRLANTTFIQRTATTGGLPPAPAECDATTANTTVEVAYTADYHFWKKSGVS